MNDRDREWLETDGLGGFASGTVSGVRTRRYHGLLVSALTPPTGRTMLVSGFDATIETLAGRWMLSSQRYAPDVVAGDGEQHIEAFVTEPWPTWTFRLPDGTRVVQEIFVRHGGAPVTFVCWRLEPGNAARLCVRPFLAGRDFHALMHENPAFAFEPERHGDNLRFSPYGGPAIVVAASGAYRHGPLWYRRFLYEEERRRGLDCEEDLAAPGEWSFDLAAGEAVLAFGCARGGEDLRLAPARAAVDAARAAERARRATLGGRLERSADQYLVARREGRTLIAGYPWFGDWGRDTFIALRGLLLATGRVAEALSVLSAWAAAVSEGMLPNFFPGGGAAPEYNSVDASLWFVIACAQALEIAGLDARLSSVSERRKLVDAMEAIVDGYARGTRFGIRGDADGLLAAGMSGQQLTWMDARVRGREITPRIGKPVEVQALWLNALAAVAALGTTSASRWQELGGRGRGAFEARFWNDERGCLYDVVDVDHEPGKVDATLRPNQILAVGGLPRPLLEGARARSVVAVVERELLTPLGLRSLARGEPGYEPRYAGGVEARDGAYHQGTVWPWLMGPFVEAFVRVRGGGDDVRRHARARFLPPLRAHLDEAGLGHVSEVADGEPPHAPGGCPFQAWSLGELIRLDRVVLAASAPAPGRPFT